MGRTIIIKGTVDAQRFSMARYCGVGCSHGRMLDPEPTDLLPSRFRSVFHDFVVKPTLA